MRDPSEETFPFVILVRKDDGVRWRAELPNNRPKWRSKSGNIGAVAKDARRALGKPSRRDTSLKVAEGTELTGSDVLALIEANNGSLHLDLSRCRMREIQLGYDTIQRAKDIYVAKHGTDPPWLSDETEGVNLTAAYLQRADLYDARLQGADLKLSFLQGAHFHRAKLQSASLWWAHLEGANLIGADLEDSDLRSAQIQGVALDRAKSLKGIHWHGAILGNTQLRRDQVGEVICDEAYASTEKTADAYRQASEAYLALKNNFTSIGRYHDAAWAYVKERRMGAEGIRRQLDWRQWPSRAFWHTLGQWMLNVVWDVLAGYGETPQKPIGLGALLAVVFFPLLYWAIGSLPGHGAAFTSSSPSDIDWAGWGESIVFSLTSFGTLSFTELQPDGTLPTIIAAFEAFTGVLLFALFVFTLGNRMSRS